MNVDDVFLMLDAKTYRADYVSPNVENCWDYRRTDSERYFCFRRTAF